MSGVASINVDTAGRNSIIIVTGANDLITEKEIDDSTFIKNLTRIIRIKDMIIMILTSVSKIFTY